MTEYDTHQFILISQLFKNLQLEDSDTNLAPFNIRQDVLYEKAPYDLELEDECGFGIKCIFKKNPLICHKNHQGINKISKNNYIPTLLCKYERPWKIYNNKSIKCNNIYCWFSHLKGRKEHLQQILLNISK